jgi:predicted ATPase
MISALRQENFKCFSELALPLAPLTLFTGLNAAGKSSSLQTLLLLVQSSRGRQDASSLKLNGSIATLGTSTDVINMNIGGTRLALGFTSHESSFLWRFVVNSGDESKSLVVAELELQAQSCGVSGPMPPTYKPLKSSWTR